MDPSRIFVSRMGSTCCRPLDYVEPADDHITETEEITITAHGPTDIQVVYTNDPVKVESIIKMYKEWLAIDEDKFKMKFVGLDIEYTRSHTVTGEPQQIALIQLAMRRHVLVVHFCRYVKHC